MTEASRTTETISAPDFPLWFPLLSAALLVAGIHLAQLLTIPSPLPVNIGAATSSMVLTWASLRWFIFALCFMALMPKTRPSAADQVPMNDEHSPSPAEQKGKWASIIGPALFTLPLWIASPYTAIVFIVSGVMVYCAPALFRLSKTVGCIVVLLWLPVGCMAAGVLGDGYHEFSCRNEAKIADLSGKTYRCQSIVFLRSYNAVVIRNGNEAVFASLSSLQKTSITESVKNFWDIEFI